MSTTILHKHSDAFTDAALPKLTRSPNINLGGLFRLDFTDPYTLNGATLGVVIPDGFTLKNMVDGSVDATAALTSTGVLVAADGKGLVVTASSSNPAVFVGFPAGAFDMHDAGDHAFIQHLWAATDASGQQLNANWFGARSGTTNTADIASPIWGSSAGPVFMVNNADGRTPTAYTRSGGGANSVNAPSGSMEGGATLFSYSFDPVAGSRVFLNGTLVATAGVPSAGTAGTVPSMRSHATLTASANVSNGDPVTVNGTTITFVASGATGTQVNIGVDAAASLTNLRNYINANSVALNARAERTLGQLATVLTVLHTGTGTLTLTEASASLTVSSITNPYAFRLLPRSLKGKIYAVAMEDLTASGRTAAQAAASEFALYRARLTELGIA